LKPKSEADLTHIASAVKNDVDYIISWNFKHFVNINTINAVNSVNTMLNYKQVQIIAPNVLLGGD
jgi:hypothetical protein